MNFDRLYIYSSKYHNKQLCRFWPSMWFWLGFPSRDLRSMTRFNIIYSLVLVFLRDASHRWALNRSITYNTNGNTLYQVSRHFVQSIHYVEHVITWWQIFTLFEKLKTKSLLYMEHTTLYRPCPGKYLSMKIHLCPLL